MNQATPFFSVIIPVRDGGSVFVQALAALTKSTFAAWELIVVDDNSADSSSSLARQHGATVLSSPGAGPAHARNLGAQHASGHFLFFLDADCEVYPHTLQQAADHLKATPDLDALFGSYDDAPAAQNLISQYKNLQHHYVHQTSNPEAQTFWTGCGCVRRDLFVALGGFDAARYSTPAIEDIEFGYRLKARGGRIRLEKTVQVKHLKRWTLRSWISADIFARAVPWTQLLLDRPMISADLNLQWHQRLSGAVATLLLPTLVLPQTRRWSIGLVSLLLHLNASFYRFLWRKRGLRFLIRILPLHWLYYVYSTITFGAMLIKHKVHNMLSKQLDTQ